MGTKASSEDKGLVGTKQTWWGPRLSSEVMGLVGTKQTWWGPRALLRGTIMEIRKLNNEFEKVLFLREYNQKANMNVPIEYIFDCEVYAVFINSQMEGGFAFAQGSDMAWPQVLPDANEFFDSVPKSLCLEINLVWAKGNLHKSYSKMMKFWLTITRLASNKDGIEYITFAVDSRRSYLVSMYERLSSGRIFSGEVPKYPGRSAIVFYTSPFRCKYSKFICIEEFLIRYKRKLKGSTKPESDLGTAFLRTKAS